MHSLTLYVLFIIIFLSINAQHYPADGRGLCLCKCCKDRECYITETTGSFALINGNRCNDSKYGCTQINCAKQFPSKCSLQSDEEKIIAECHPMIF